MLWFPSTSVFTFYVFWGSLGTSIFGNSSSSTNDTRSRLTFRLSFHFLWLCSQEVPTIVFRKFCKSGLPTDEISFSQCLIWDHHSFSIYAKFSEKLTFLIPWFASWGWGGRIRNFRFSENFSYVLNERSLWTHCNYVLSKQNLLCWLLCWWAGYSWQILNARYTFLWYVFPKTFVKL